MTRAVAVLRPEPGNARTAAALAALGLSVVPIPLFRVVPLDWTPPAPDAFDAMLLTSGNAVRHGGAPLAALTGLRVIAVGEATARAARAAGFTVVLTGTADAAMAVAAARRAGFDRLLHLAGREHVVSTGTVLAIPVYASDAIAPSADDLRAIEGSVAMLHSVRAAQVLAACDLARATIRVVALSDAVAMAAGTGWQRTMIAPQPTDAALIALARTLAIDP